MKKHRLKCFIQSLVIVVMFVMSVLSSGSSTVTPKEGFVPNEATAIAIAEAVLRPIYGAEVEAEKPYHAKLVNGVWWVGGTLPRGRVGGVAVVRISKKDAHIISVIHGE